jgi:hypothetical protein
MTEKRAYTAVKALLTLLSDGRHPQHGPPQAEGNYLVALGVGSGDSKVDTDADHVAARQVMVRVHTLQILEIARGP